MLCNFGTSSSVQFSDEAEHFRTGRVSLLMLEKASNRCGYGRDADCFVGRVLLQSILRSFRDTAGDVFRHGRRRRTMVAWLRPWIERTTLGLIALGAPHVEPPRTTLTVPDSDLLADTRSRRQSCTRCANDAYFVSFCCFTTGHYTSSVTSRASCFAIVL